MKVIAGDTVVDTAATVTGIQNTSFELKRTYIVPSGKFAEGSSLRVTWTTGSNYYNISGYSYMQKNGVTQGDTVVAGGNCYVVASRDIPIVAGDVITFWGRNSSGQYASVSISDIKFGIGLSVFTPW